MTVPHDVPAMRAPSLISALGALRMRGMRVSTARRQVLEVLYAAAGPLTAEKLAARLPGSDLASIYRNLDVLEELGLVRHMHLGHGPSQYSLAAGRDVELVRASAAARSRRWTRAASTESATRSRPSAGSARTSATSRSSASVAECQSLPEEETVSSVRPGGSARRRARRRRRVRSRSPR